MLSKKVEYMTFKTSILPRLLSIIETSTNGKLREKGLESLLAILKVLDRNILRD